MDDDAQVYIAEYEAALRKEYQRGYGAGKAAQPAQEPQRLWVDLTRTQIQNVYFAVLEEHRGVPQMQGQLAFGEALQAAIKEKNT